MALTTGHFDIRNTGVSTCIMYVCMWIVRTFCLYNRFSIFGRYSWLSLSRTRLTRISGWVEFLLKSRTSLCINIYNLTPVESNSDESKFRLSRIKVLVPRCRKPYNLHLLSQIYLSKHVYYLTSLGLKSDHRWNIRSLTLTFLP